MINSLDLNQHTDGPIIINGGDKDKDKDGNKDNGRGHSVAAEPGSHLQIPPGAIYAKVVEKCGDRKYWPQWAEDVAQIADRIRARVSGCWRTRSGLRCAAISRRSWPICGAP